VVHRRQALIKVASLMRRSALDKSVLWRRHKGTHHFDERDNI